MTQTVRAIQSLVVSLILIVVMLSLVAPVMESISEDGEPDDVPFSGASDAVRDMVAGGFAWLESLPASLPALAGLGVLLLALVKRDSSRRGVPGGEQRDE